MVREGVCFSFWINGPRGKVQCINTKKFLRWNRFFPRPRFCSQENSCHVLTRDVNTGEIFVVAPAGGWEPQHMGIFWVF